MTENEQKRVPPTRTVGLLTGVLYGIGCGIGGSIFLLLGEAIFVANSGVLISLIFGGILIFLIALNYSELSTSLPISGGAYNFSKEALGGFLAFIIGFFLLVANIAFFSFSAQAFAVVIITFFSINLLPPILVLIFFITIAIGSILLTAAIVFRTKRLAMRTLIILTVILLFIFAVFIISGLFIAPSIKHPSFAPEFLFSDTDFLSIFQMFSLMFIFFTSITSNLVYLNPNIKNPSKNIPKVNIIAIVITLLIYLAISVVVLINIGNDTSGLKESPNILAEILYNILGIPGRILMGIAALISTLIAMTASLGSSVSVMHALARDNYISKKLIKVNKKTNVPTRILIIITLISIIFTFLAISFADIGFTANITIFIYFIGLAFINLAAINLRRKRKELDRPFKAPFFPLLPIIVMFFCVVLALFLQWSAIVLGVVIFIIGIVYYLFMIADRHSIILTLAGLKFFALLLLGIFIWIINNVSFLSSPFQGFITIFKDVLLRILIFICIFSLGTVFLDVFPLKELVYFFVKKINKGEVAIDVGIGQIIELKKSKTKIIYYTNISIGIIQIFSSIFIFILISLFAFEVISINEIIIGNTVIPHKTSEFIFFTILIFTGTVLLICGPFKLYLSRETKTLGI